MTKVAVIRKVLRNSYNTFKGKHKQPVIPEGYTMDKKLSGKRVQVYHRDADKQQLVVHRGTQGFQDIVTDIKLATGLLKTTNRYKHSKKIANEAAKLRPDYETTHLGHSLGGALARNVAKKGQKVVTYNTAVTPQDFLVRGKGKEVNIRSALDPVSLFASVALPNVKVVPGVSHSFGPLNDRNTRRLTVL